ncbi:hypothetical protein GYMLUDRAFT_46925 [Collybiopsis luxurians FD-317 M1]|uniref:Fungal-type protein kinase domain-containing protein n=1 Tax=Collybiopsis luxurians FD-317 M1 TaxID=944289 RepID=A0A0D0BNM7_9AGAR|nr:hypothetical protein GYMLUDRAFT_46925 [Collybiopsis luxurians FD-317 M1]
MRTRIKEDHNDDLITCSPTTFLKTYASKEHLTKDVVKAVTKSLKQRGLLDENGWTRLQQSHKKSENNAYSFFGPVAQAIQTAAKTTSMPLRPQSDAHPSPTSSSRHSKPGYTFFPDWRAVALSSTVSMPRNSNQTVSSLVDTSAIIAIGEFELAQSAEKICDNESKMVGAANQLLWNDPCRERVLGFTVENRRTRFWDFSRTAITVSEPFDLDKNPKYLIEFFLFILYAERHEIGFDPTVHPVPLSDGKLCFCYEAGGEYYLTVGQPLSEESAFRMVGRATRVWVVIRLSKTSGNNIGDVVIDGINFTRDDSCKYVLKDAWLYEDALLEMQIQSNLLANVSDKEELRNHFLTFLVDEQVRFQGKARWALRCPESKFTEEKWQQDDYVHHNSSRSSSRPSREKPVHERPKPPRPTRPHPIRKHIRSVAKEVCESLYQLMDLTDALICWKDMIKCLSYLREAGYTHRDMSGGNCLLYRCPETNTRKGIISDLEYCKRYMDLSVHDPKTGTPDFMAVEVQEQSLLFMDHEKIQTSRKLFVPHFVHDLESIYWQYIWFLHHRVAVHKEPTAENIKFVQQWAKNYFGYDMDGSGPRRALINPGVHVYALKEELLRIHSKKILVAVDFSLNLRKEYQRLETNPPRVHKNLLLTGFNNDIYEDFGQKLSKILKHCSGGYPFEPLKEAQSPLESKRKRKQEVEDSNTALQKKPRIQLSDLDSESEGLSSPVMQKPDLSSQREIWRERERQVLMERKRSRSRSQSAQPRTSLMLRTKKMHKQGKQK